MNIETFRTYCINLKGTSEGFPFDENTLVFKVGDKMFALADVASFTSVSCKCDPEQAVALREAYVGITPGYHMNKKHWNTIQINEDVPDALVFRLVKHSYDLVVASLPKKVRDELQN